MKVVDPLRHRAVVMLEGHDEPRLARHGGAEFERRADGVVDVQGAALMRTFDPLRRQSGLFEIELRLLQIFLAEAAHADPLGLRCAGALEDERVMARFGDAAQIDRILVLVADNEADEIDVKRAAFAEVGHVQHRHGWRA